MLEDIIVIGVGLIIIAVGMWFIWTDPKTAPRPDNPPPKNHSVDRMNDEGPVPPGYGE